MHAWRRHLTRTPCVVVVHDRNGSVPPQITLRRNCVCMNSSLQLLPDAGFCSAGVCARLPNSTLQTPGTKLQIPDATRAKQTGCTPLPFCARVRRRQTGSTTRRRHPRSPQRRARRWKKERRARRPWSVISAPVAFTPNSHVQKDSVFVFLVHRSLVSLLSRAPL